MRRPVLRVALALVVLAASSRVARAGSLTPSEARGRRIYLSGESASARPITAIVGESTELAARILTCGSCHGPDGRGVPEGTIEPADVRWSTLMKSRIPAEGAGGRLRPRYDPALLGRAVSEGVDSAGNRLSSIMPRYRIGEDDLRDLIAYLQRLGDEPQPGVSATAITVVTAMPLSGPRAQVGELTRKVIDASFDDVNQSGGIFGRTLELQAIDSAAGDATKRLTELLDGEAAFVIVCASLAELDPSVGSRIRSERVPLITPLPSDASDASAPSSFFLFPDMESQAIELTRHIGEPSALQTRNVWILHDPSGPAVAAAAAVERHGNAPQWTLRGKVTTLESLAPPAAGNDDDLLFLIGGGVNTADVLRRLRQTKWRPRILIAGASLDGGVFDAATSFEKKIFVAVPTLPTDVTAVGKRELRAFSERHRLPAAHLATQLATVSTVKVFVEGLKRAGRDVTREKLIAALEQLYQFATELTPPITFGRNRHIGSPGAHVMEIDLDRRWVAPISGRGDRSPSSDR